MDSAANQSGQEDRENRSIATQADKRRPQRPQRPRGHELRRSLTLVTIAWLFGSVYFSSTSGAPITLYAQGLGASKFQFGLLAALPFLATLLLSVPSSLLIDKTGIRKEILLITHYVHRMIWILIALVPMWMIQSGNTWAAENSVKVFLLLVFLNYCGQSMGGPAWFGWMADIVPERIHGRYFSRRRSIGILTAIPAAITTGLLLDHFRQPGQPADSLQTLRWCGYIFLAAAIFGVIDIALHQTVPNIRAVPHPHSLLGIFKVPLRNRQFMIFTGFTGTLWFAVGYMGQFVPLYLIEKLKVTNTGVQLITLVSPCLAQLVFLSAWGRAVDRLGRKPVLIIASLGFVPVAFGWCFMNSGAIWLGYLLTAAGAALFAGVEVANVNMWLQFSGTDDELGHSSSTYFAVSNVINNGAGFLGGIFAGVVAQGLETWSWDIGILGLAPIGFYEVLFALSGVLRLAAVILFLPRIHEPDSKPAAQALRFMTVNIYNNLFSALSLPLRAIVRR